MISAEPGWTSSPDNRLHLRRVQGHLFTPEAGV